MSRADLYTLHERGTDVITPTETAAKHVCAMLVTMSITITAEPARQPELVELMEAGAAYAHSLYPPEENFLLDVEELEVPGIVVYVARDDSGRALGMVGRSFR